MLNDGRKPAYVVSAGGLATLLGPVDTYIGSPVCHVKATNRCFAYQVSLLADEGRAQ